MSHIDRLKDLKATSGFITNGLFPRPLEFFSSVGPTVNELTFGLLGQSFVPQRDIRDLTGKVVFVTGGMFNKSNTHGKKEIKYHMSYFIVR